MYPNEGIRYYCQICVTIFVFFLWPFNSVMALLCCHVHLYVIIKGLLAMCISAHHYKINGVKQFIQV